MSLDRSDDIIEREHNINTLLNDAIENPLINSMDMARLFEAFSGAVMIYERIDVNLITPLLDIEVNENRPFKDFLLSYIDLEQTTTVQQAINSVL